MAKSTSRGHPIKSINGGPWFYDDTGGNITDERDRGCARCGKPPTVDGHDACIGYVYGVSSACCGHGVMAATVYLDENCQGYISAHLLAQRLFVRNRAYDLRCKMNHLTLELVDMGI